MLVSALVLTRVISRVSPPCQPPPAQPLQLPALLLAPTLSVAVDTPNFVQACTKAADPAFHGSLPHVATSDDPW